MATKAKRKRGAGLSTASMQRIKVALRRLAPSEAWIDAQFHRVEAIGADGEPIAMTVHDARRADPTFNPRTGRLADDGGRCRRVVCRCCGVPTPGSGFALATLEADGNGGTCLCRDCGISGTPQEQQAKVATSRDLAARLLRSARAIRLLQNAYGSSPWHTFRERIERFGLTLPWDKKR